MKTTREKVKELYNDKSLWKPPSYQTIATILGTTKSLVARYLHDGDGPKTTNRSTSRSIINDPNLKLKQRIENNLRGRLRISLRTMKTIKNNKTMVYVGCSKDDFVNHIASKFTEGMSWQNYGEWEIDHIYPLSKFDLTKEDEIFKAMNYTNMQPLWMSDNRKKSNKLTNHNPQF